MKESRADMPAVTCLVLAGGLGTRLQQAVAGLPKCLAPILGRPFLVYQLDALNRSAIKRVVLCTGHLAEQVERAIGTTHDGMTISYSRESRPLGTGGAARLAVTGIPDAEDFLVVNGDSFLEADLQTAYKTYVATGRVPMMLLARVSDTARYGRVEVHDATATTTSVARFLEKGAGGSGWINAGIYFLPRETLLALPPHGTVSLERDLFPALASAGKLTAMCTPGRFIDIGTPESYGAADLFFRVSGSP